MANHLVPGYKIAFTWQGPTLAVFIDPSDFTEIGQAYRHKCIRVEAVTLVWGVIVPIALAIITGGK